jgi:hypothetical protein
MRQLRDMFSDRTTLGAAIVFLLIIVVVVFNTYSTMPEQYPLFGVFCFTLVPILFVVGGIFFVRAILKT